MPEISDRQAEEAVQAPPEEEISTAQQEPEPGAEETTSQGEAAAELSGEPEETQAEGTDDDWLPDEQKKEFPLEELIKFAKHRNYGFSAEDIAANDGIRRLIQDKLNTDIHIRNLQQQLGGDEDQTDELSALLGEEGLELDEEQGQQQAAVQPQATQAPAFTDPRAAHYQRVEALVSRVDPKATEELGRNVLSVLGVNTDPKYIESLQAKLNNPNTQPQERMQIQEYLGTVNGAGKLGGTLAKGALDLVLTTLPQIMPELIEQIYPGTQLRYQRGVAAESWENLSTAQGKDQKPLYPNLPKFGSQEYRTMVLKVEKGMGLPPGGLGAMAFRDATGNPLPPEKQLQATMRIIAKAASGQRISPAVVSQALQTGKRQASEQAQRRAQGRALGSGQPTSHAGGDDAFKRAILAHNASQKSI